MDIQQAITFLILMVATTYLGRMAWRKATGQESGCDGCSGNCGKPVASPHVRPAPKATPLVTLGPPPRRPKSP